MNLEDTVQHSVEPTPHEYHTDGGPIAGALWGLSARWWPLSELDASLHVQGGGWLLEIGARFALSLGVMIDLGWSDLSRYWSIRLGLGVVEILWEVREFVTAPEHPRTGEYVVHSRTPGEFELVMVHRGLQDGRGITAHVGCGTYESARAAEEAALNHFAIRSSQPRDSLVVRVDAGNVTTEADGELRIPVRVGRLEVM